MHYTNKPDFQAITEFPGILELKASRAKYDPSDLLDCGFGQGLYCVAKPTKEFDIQEGLIIMFLADPLTN